MLGAIHARFCWSNLNFDEIAAKNWDWGWMRDDSSPHNISQNWNFLTIFIEKFCLTSKKRLCKILELVLRVGKFNVDHIWSLVHFVSSILLLTILIFFEQSRAWGALVFLTVFLKFKFLPVWNLWCSQDVVDPKNFTSYSNYP